MNVQDWLSRLAPGEKLLWHGKPTGRYPVSGFDKVFSALAALGILIGFGLLAYDLTLGKSSDLPRGPVMALVFLALGGGLGSVRTGIGFRNIADGDEVYKYLLFARKYARPKRG